MKQIKDGRKELYVVNDKDGTPTYTHDFARNVKLLLAKGYWGLYNMVCGGETSRLEVAREIVRLVGLEDKVKVNEVPSDYFSKEYFADRPACERLVNRKLNIRYLNIMRDWKVALGEYLQDYYAEYLR